MDTHSPEKIWQACEHAGHHKMYNHWSRTLFLAFNAGSYIALGGIFATSVAKNLGVTNGVAALINGCLFTVGIIMILLTGAELLTSNMMYVTITCIGHVRRDWKVLLWGCRNLFLVWTGNFMGGVCTAYFLAYQTGVLETVEGALIHLANVKVHDLSNWRAFIRAVGCNYLVCLGVFISVASPTVSGKIMAVFLPIVAFVAIGFEHCVANMFYFPAALFYGHNLPPATEHSTGEVLEFTAGQALCRILLDTVGNWIGANLILVTFFYFGFARVYLQDRHAAALRKKSDAASDLPTVSPPPAEVAAWSRCGSFSPSPAPNQVPMIVGHYKHKDGQFVPAEVSMNLIRGFDGLPQKVVEEVVENGDTSHPGFIVLNVSGDAQLGTVEYADQQFCHMLGRDPAEVVNQPMESFLAADDANLMRNCLHRAVWGQSTTTTTITTNTTNTPSPISRSGGSHTPTPNIPVSPPELNPDSARSRPVEIALPVPRATIASQVPKVTVVSAVPKATIDPPAKFPRASIVRPEERKVSIVIPYSYGF